MVYHGVSLVVVTGRYDFNNTHLSHLLYFLQRQQTQLRTSSVLCDVDDGLCLLMLSCVYDEYYVPESDTKTPSSRVLTP